MPPAREPFGSELAILRQEAPRAVAAWVVTAGLGGRISPTDQRDLAQDLLAEFVAYWRTSFEFGACTPGGAAGPADIASGLRLAVRGLAHRFLPLALNRQAYGGAVRVTRYGVDQGEHGGAVEYEGGRDHRQADDDIEAAVELAELRERIVRRLLELADGGPDGGLPAWFRGLEMATGVEAETIMARDGISRRTAHYGRDLLVRLFRSDVHLSALVAEAEGAEGMAGICAEVLARSSTACPEVDAAPTPARFCVSAPALPVIGRGLGYWFTPAGPRPAGCRSSASSRRASRGAVPGRHARIGSARPSGPAEVSRHWPRPGSLRGHGGPFSANTGGTIPTRVSTDGGAAYPGPFRHVHFRQGPAFPWSFDGNDSDIGHGQARAAPS